MTHHLLHSSLCVKISDQTMTKKVLIVDDEGDFNKIMKLRLTKSGFTVETALNGTSGIEKARQFKPDYILLDIGMPGMDGWEVCRLLRANKQTRHIKIIVLTALRDISPAKKVGADRVILKPFNFDEILDVLK